MYVICRYACQLANVCARRIAAGTAARSPAGRVEVSFFPDSYALAGLSLMSNEWPPINS